MTFEPALVILFSLVLVAIGALAGYFFAGRITTEPDPAIGPSTDPAVDGQDDSDEDSRLLARLSDAVDHIDQAIIVRNESGTDDFRNAAGEALRESRHSRVLVEAAVDELLAEALNGRSVSREIDLFGPPARSFVIVARPFKGAGGSGALAIVEDVTLKRRTETVRRDFVANISHELKSPVGAIGLLADMIRDETDPEVVTRLSGRMVGEAERASHTIDDLLELTKIEFHDETDFAEVNLASIVHEAVERISSAASQAGIAVHAEVPEHSPVVGDRIQLVSAVYNLLDNAVKYSPEGSSVTVTATPDAGDGKVLIDVVDKGVGIPRRDLDRVFERFYRVDKARSRGTGGTGLGLAIVRHVANNHGGEVSVESIEGVGTTFSLSFAPKPKYVNIAGLSEPEDSDDGAPWSSRGSTSAQSES
ncbi:MAG TPA: ATP-binding protein [Microthrixaceae bacterium]|nr:ATP-binding protein [Microthrixaceae bacterium]